VPTSWRNISDNPVAVGVHRYLLKYVKASVRVNNDINYTGYIIRETTGKKVLDIGVCEHDLVHMRNTQNWKHGLIKQFASSVVGVDILPKLVKELNSNGYNIKLVDATSETYLGEKFEIVFIGDVIEHVNDPVKLLLFARRHLNKKGKVIINTPNPFFITFILSVFRYGACIANAEHVSWITPTNMLEIAYRAGLRLTAVVYNRKSKNVFVRVLKKILPLDFFTSAYTYEISF
jgi:2-polyprenyl-3-methyl-5-hydroxy-6-metoxy-1,4-benzoquinol methylase